MCTAIYVQFLSLIEVVQSSSQLTRFAGCVDPYESLVDPTIMFIHFMALTPNAQACTAAGQAILRCIVKLNDKVMCMLFPDIVYHACHARSPT